MHRFAVAFLCLTASLLLTGCPFGFDSPVAPPKGGTLDASLTGVFTLHDGEETVIVEFLPFNDAEHLAETRWCDTTGCPKRELYRTYLLSIGGQQFLQIQRLDSEPRSFFLARYSVDDTGVTLRFVSDTVVPKDLKSDTTKLVAFIEKNLDGSKLEGAEAPTLLKRAKK